MESWKKSKFLFNVKFYYKSLPGPKLISNLHFQLIKNCLRILLGFLCGFVLGEFMFSTHILPESGCFSKKDIGWNSDVKTIANSGSIYIGLMSTDKFRDTRIAAAVDTWMKHIPYNVKIEVFANNKGTKDPERGFRQDFLSNGVRVIQLPGVSDNVYPPQKKGISMIKFMHDMYIDKYDWFVRMDDDAYVKVQKLLKFLSRINSSEPLYIGRPGFGKHEDDFLKEGDNYCMGGPGVIISNGLLRLLAPNLKYCLKNLFTEHEDVEVGRCIHKMTGVKCTSSFETNSLFYQNYQNASHASYFHDPAYVIVEKGITFHANKNPEHQCKLHMRILKMRLQKIITKIIRLEKVVDDLMFKSVDEFNKIFRDNIWSGLNGTTLFTTNRNCTRKLGHSMKQTLKDYQFSYLNLRNIPLQPIYDESTEFAYHHVNPLLSTDIVSETKIAERNKPKRWSKFLHQRQYFPKRLHFFHEPFVIKLGQGGPRLRV